MQGFYTLAEYGSRQYIAAPYVPVVTADSDSGQFLVGMSLLNVGSEDSRALQY